VPELVSTLLPLLAIGLVFWLLIIRPQSRRQKALRELRASLAPGDRVMMTAGIFATVRRVDGDRAMVEIADGTVVEIATAAIGSVEGRADVDTAGDHSAPTDRVTGTDTDPTATGER
jgi:preprotein translocase subunit YajC